MFRSALFLAALFGAAAAAHTREAAVPSGLDVQLFDQRIEAQYDGTALARYRFVAPALATGVGFETVADDFAHLCEAVALPDLEQSSADLQRDSATDSSADAGKHVGQIVISFASEPLDFGVTAPEVIQFFEVFRIENDRCIWEAF